jgi:hypothetical protein
VRPVSLVQAPQRPRKRDEGGTRREGEGLAFDAGHHIPVPGAHLDATEAAHDGVVVGGLKPGDLGLHDAVAQG